jgi:hypothetical protein
MGKIRAIIKRPDEKYGHMTYMSSRTENLQRTVGGLIEAVTLEDIVILCNEEGKLLGLEDNMPSPIDKNDVIAGTIIICGYNDERDGFGDLTWDFAKWKRFVDEKCS